MYGIYFAYIYYKKQPHVGKYTIHVSYEICPLDGKNIVVSNFFHLPLQEAWPANSVTEIDLVERPFFETIPKKLVTLKTHQKTNSVTPSKHELDIWVNLPLLLQKAIFGIPWRRWYFGMPTSGMGVSTDTKGKPPNKSEGSAKMDSALPLKSLFSIQKISNGDQNSHPTDPRK